MPWVSGGVSIKLRLISRRYFLARACLLFKESMTRTSFGISFPKISAGIGIGVNSGGLRTLGNP